MNFFLAILFVCGAGQCAFMHSDQKYFDKQACEKDVSAVVEAYVEQGIVARGTCLPVSVRDVL